MGARTAGARHLSLSLFVPPTTVPLVQLFASADFKGERRGQTKMWFFSGAKEHFWECHKCFPSELWYPSHSKDVLALNYLPTLCPLPIGFLALAMSVGDIDEVAFLGAFFFQI